MRPETEYCAAAVGSVTTHQSESVESGKATQTKDPKHMQMGRYEQPEKKLKRKLSSTLLHLLKEFPAIILPARRCAIRTGVHLLTL